MARTATPDVALGRTGAPGRFGDVPEPATMEEPRGLGNKQAMMVAEIRVVRASMD